MAISPPPSTAERIVSAAIERFGRIDTLVNNAGVFVPKPFVDYTDSDFATMTGTNLAGFFHLSQKVASSMLRSGTGHIVNITATIAEQPMEALPAALAALTKGGLDAVTRSLRRSGPKLLRDPPRCQRGTAQQVTSVVQTR